MAWLPYLILERFSLETQARNVEFVISRTSKSQLNTAFEKSSLASMDSLPKLGIKSPVNMPWVDLAIFQEVVIHSLRYIQGLHHVEHT